MDTILAAAMAEESEREGGRGAAMLSERRPCKAADVPVDAEVAVGSSFLRVI